MWAPKSAYGTSKEADKETGGALIGARILTRRETAWLSKDSFERKFLKLSEI